MKRFIEVIARTSDLVEAHGGAMRSAIRAEARELRASVRNEGRELRGVVASAGLALLCLLMAAACFLAGAGLILAAVYMWLDARYGEPIAAASVGAAVIVIGGVAVWSYKHLMAE